MVLIMIKKLKLILGLILSLSFFSSCVQKEKSDMPENLSVILNNNQPIKLYHHENYIELAGVFCDFFQDEKNKESYAVLMEKLNKKSWKFDHIGLDYENCWNDSMTVAFVKLNLDIFGAKLEAVTFEEGVIAIELRSDSN